MDKLQDRSTGVDFKSSQYHVKEFIDGVVWNDIKGELEAVIVDIRNSLELCNNMTEIARYQGRAEALRYVLMLPGEMLEAIKSTIIKDGEE